MKRVTSAELQANPAAVFAMAKDESVTVVRPDGTDGIVIHPLSRPHVDDHRPDECPTTHCVDALVAENAALRQSLHTTEVALNASAAAYVANVDDAVVRRIAAAEIENVALRDQLTRATDLLIDAHGTIKIADEMFGATHRCDACDFLKGFT